MSQDLIVLHEQAAQWFVRRSEPGWTGADERALNAWLAGSPQRREVYESMALTGHDLHHIPLAQESSWRQRATAPASVRRDEAATQRGQLATPAPAPAAAATQLAAALRRDTAERRDVAGRRDVAHGRAPGDGGAGAGRRTWLTTALAAGALLAVGAGLGWQHWRHAPTYELAVTTAPAEVRTLNLPDGSTITLNINSKLTVRYSNRRREVVLDGGEAFFKVARDASRPFTVASGASEVKVVGTAFNVRATAAQTVVKVLEGRVEVRPDSQASRPQVYVLKAGSGLGIDPASHRTRSIAVATDTVGDWRTGQLHFRNAPLSEVAAELQTYLGHPVVVEGALARQPISGVASTSDARAFLQALPVLLPLRVQQQPDGSWRIAAR